MTGNFQHHSLAEGRWVNFTLAEQLGHIGSEVSRALKAKEDRERLLGATKRALELFDLTLRDPRWRKRLKELCRARELFCDAIYGGPLWGTRLEDLDRYFTYFAYAARVNKR